LAVKLPIGTVNQRCDRTRERQLAENSAPAEPKIGKTIALSELNSNPMDSPRVGHCLASLNVK
jgi:hypothetical protein